MTRRIGRTAGCQQMGYPYCYCYRTAWSCCFRKSGWCHLSRSAYRWCYLDSEDHMRKDTDRCLLFVYYFVTFGMRLAPLLFRCFYRTSNLANCCKLGRTCFPSHPSYFYEAQIYRMPPTHLLVIKDPKIYRVKVSMGYRRSLETLYPFRTWPLS